MKNKNKKEIDVIVEEIKNFPYHIRVENNPQKLANNILTKLKENEIVLAKGRVKIETEWTDDDCQEIITKVSIGNEEVYSIIDEKELKDKTITLKAVIEDE